MAHFSSSSCYSKWSAFVHLVKKSGQIQDKNDEKAISRLIKSLKKLFKRNVGKVSICYRRKGTYVLQMLWKIVKLEDTYLIQYLHYAF